LPLASFSNISPKAVWSVNWDDHKFIFATPATWAREWSDHHWFDTSGQRALPAVNISVDVTTDPTLFAELRRLAKADDWTRVAAYGSPGYFCRGLVAGRETLVAADWACLRKATAAWEIIIPIAKTDFAPEKRLAAEIVKTSALRNSGFEVHAATVSLAGRGVLFVGGSGVGKTTLSIVVGRRGSLISGDRTMATRSDGIARLVGFPDTTRVGIGTARALGLAESLRSAPLLRPQDFLDAGEIAASCFEHASPRKAVLTRLELNRIFRVPMGVTVSPSDVVMVTYDASAESPQLTPSNGEEIQDEFFTEVLTGKPHHETWLESGELADDMAGRVRAFLNEVRVWRLRWCPSASGAEQVADMLARSAAY
jgi:hypothetical protein